MPQKSTDRLLPGAVLVGILAALAVLAIDSFNIAENAAAYPQVLIAICFVLALIQVIDMVFKRTESRDTDVKKAPFSLTDGKIGIALFCICWLLYPIALTLIGFILSTTLALFLSVLIFRVRRPWMTLIGILIFVIVFAVLLKTVIYIPVPEAWPDTFIDTLIYSL